MIARGDSGVHGKVTTPLKTPLLDEALEIDLSTANKQQQKIPHFRGSCRAGSITRSRTRSHTYRIGNHLPVSATLVCMCVCPLSDFIGVENARLFMIIISRGTAVLPVLRRGTQGGIRMCTLLR